MLINFKKLEQLGFEVREVSEGVMLSPVQASEALAMRTQRALQEETELSPMEIEQVLDETVAAVNRLTIARAITTGR